jgi:NodT family efflux transporter outer membrane factor (OMF) lipoprotein
MRRAHPSLSILACAAMAACTVGPTYHRPDEPTPPAFTEAAAMPRAPIPAADPDLAGWWRTFNDPILDDLIQRGLAGNPDLLAAESRVREARRQVTITAAAAYPAINASGNAIAYNSNRKTAAAQGAGGSGGEAGLVLPSHLNLYSAGFDATWEVDLFGGTRRSVEAARANAEATVWTRRDGQVSLIAEIANDYLTLRVLQDRLALGQAELRRQQNLFGLISARRKAGFVTDLDVNQQSTVVAAAAAQLPQLDAEARVQIHALGILVGLPPEALAQALVATPSALPAPPPALPVGLPSDLLKRRPDVREAERRLAAANATIGAREADLFPKLNLIGLGSFAGMSLNGLFDSQNLSSVGIGMLTQPVFNAGKTRASIDAAKEAKIQAELAYRGTVISAFRDVEDALARYASEDQRRAQLAQSLAAAQNSLSIAQDQYRVGLVAFNNVLLAENAVLNGQDQLAQSDGQRLTDLVSLYKALGGGWSV